MSAKEKATLIILLYILKLLDNTKGGELYALKKDILAALESEQ